MGCNYKMGKEKNSSSSFCQKLIRCSKTLRYDGAVGQSLDPGKSRHHGWDAGILIRLVGLILAAVLISGQAVAHEFYVSISKVKWDADAKKLVVSVRIFSDNLQEGIENMGGPKLNLWTYQEHGDSDKWVAGYINSRLDFTVNGREVALVFQEKADALDATACLFHIEDVQQVRSIEVRNEILTELIDDQTNIVRFDIKGNKKFMNLTKKMFRAEESF